MSVNLKGFFVTALGQALELGIATPDDVLRHVTPDILAAHLPRPLWARLLTACLGASKVDATLVVETIGVPNLCEHVPIPVIWACIGEIAQRSLGQDVTFKPVSLTSVPAAVPTEPASRPILTRPTGASPPLSVSSPPPATSRTPTSPSQPVVGPNIPTPSSSLADVVAALESDDRSGPTSQTGRARTPTSQRFRQSNTGIGRLAASNAARRPQAAAPAPAAEAPRVPASAMPVRRGATEAEYDVETEVGKDDWKNTLAVEDEQLVDWSASDETVTRTPDDSNFRKR